MFLDDSWSSETLARLRDSACGAVSQRQETSGCVHRWQLRNKYHELVALDAGLSLCIAPASSSGLMPTRAPSNRPPWRVCADSHPTRSRPSSLSSFSLPKTNNTRTRFRVAPQPKIFEGSPSKSLAGPPRRPPPPFSVPLLESFELASPMAGSSRVSSFENQLTRIPPILEQYTHTTRPFSYAHVLRCARRAPGLRLYLVMGEKKRAEERGKKHKARAANEREEGCILR